MSAPTVSSEGVVTGNTYDKYGSENPVVKRLMARFEADLDALIGQVRPASLLDVGCGEGVLVHRWAGSMPQSRIVGIDLEEPSIQAGWAQRQAPNLTYIAHDAEKLPFKDGEFQLVTAIEVLEHLPHPERTLTEMARVAGGHLLVSVPREPLWRALNLARGAYVKQLGNTPGHLNHWGKRSFARLLREHGEIVELRSPLPWTMLLLRLR